MLDSRPKGRGFETHSCHCVVSLSKNINPSLVQVQPRKTRPFITERLLMGRKESNQTNKMLNETLTLSKHFYRKTTENQTVLIQIRPDKILGLICVQTVLKRLSTDIKNHLPGCVAQLGMSLIADPGEVTLNCAPAYTLVKIVKYFLHSFNFLLLQIFRRAVNSYERTA